jgi:hypothetical protein
MGAYYGLKCLQCNEVNFVYRGSRHGCCYENIYEAVPQLAQLHESLQVCRVDIRVEAYWYDDHLPTFLEWIHAHHQHPLIWTDEYHAVYFDEMKVLDDTRLLQLANLSLTISQEFDPSQWDSVSILHRQAVAAKEEAIKIAKERGLL